MHLYHQCVAIAIAVLSSPNTLLRAFSTTNVLAELTAEAAQDQPVVGKCGIISGWWLRRRRRLRLDRLTNIAMDCLNFQSEERGSGGD